MFSNRQTRIMINFAVWLCDLFKRANEERGLRLEPLSEQEWVMLDSEGAD